MTRRGTGRRSAVQLLMATTLLFAILPVQPQFAPADAAAAPDVAVTVRGKTWQIRGGSTFEYGRSSDVQLMGDWNGDGVATPGVFRKGTWYLRNRLASGNAEVVFEYGRKGDVPVVGDWNGDGRTTIGVVRGTTWRLRNRNSAGSPQVSFTYGRRGDLPVTGDWNNNGQTGIGVVRGNRWYLRNTLTGGPAQVELQYGQRRDIPVTGDWNGDGRTTVGVVRGGNWYLRDRLTSGEPNRSFTFGACGDVMMSTTGARTVPGVPTSLRGTEWARLPTSKPVVALTFDAGANADGLPSILKTLETTGTPATFFLTGDWTTKYPDLARQVAARYPVGNHTATHPDLTKLSDAEVRSEVVSAHWTIRHATGREPRPWFRFPFGARDARTTSVVNCLDYGSVRWSVDTLGWKGTSGGQSTTTVRRRVLDDLAPGSIVLMHVGSHPKDRSTLDADALPKLIEQIEARGYRCVTLEPYG